MVFLSQKVDGNMKFTGYWKVLILTFLELGNTVFLEPKSFRKYGIYWLWKVLVLNFSVMGNTVFFSAKKLMERWYLCGLFELSVVFRAVSRPCMLLSEDRFDFELICA